jgi:hypothetical protein
MFAGAILALVLLTSAAQATTVNLTDNGCGPGCTENDSLGTGVYATVAYVQDADGKSLDFTVTLSPDSSGTAVHFHNPSDSSHATFAFDLAGDPSITVSTFNVNNGSWTVSAPTKSLSGSGSFDYVLADTAGANGYAGGEASPLTFVVTPTTGALTLASVVSNSNLATFNIDIVDASKATGNIWNTAAAVPEPPTGALVGLSLVCWFFVRRRASRPAPGRADRL